MFFNPVSNLLKLSLGLSVPFLLFRTYAYGSVSAPVPAQEIPLLAQFKSDPTRTDPFDSDSTTTGGRYFQPPSDITDFDGARTTTGTRSGSCSNVTDGVVFSGLGPRSTVGLTTSVRPEFVWYMTEIAAESPVLFRLLELDEAGQPNVVDSVELSAQAGFMRYQLPDTVSPLEVGKDYLWQVIVRCDPARSSFWASTLSLQVVTPSPELTDALATATTDAEQARIYGNAGIWYNALALVSTGTNNVETEVRTGLLQDLATLESDDAIFSTTLMTIVEQTK